ncbi:uncharacterized protein G2W53_020591 [Senna tora]|uniref:Uncharacterized protein n=1 Tax=Senna tora TaxID=362788 RepID=A0A834TWN3_9FABA|nr:uncharacterized protein G2W53_020591 [Senna tora]
MTVVGNRKAVSRELLPRVIEDDFPIVA